MFNTFKGYALGKIHNVEFYFLNEPNLSKYF